MAVPAMAPDDKCFGGPTAALTGGSDNFEFVNVIIKVERFVPWDLENG